MYFLFVICSINASSNKESKYFLENETKIDSILEILQYRIEQQYLHNFDSLLRIAEMEYLFLNNEYSDLEILSKDISNFWFRSCSGDMKISFAIQLFTEDFTVERIVLWEILSISKNIVEFRFTAKKIRLYLLNLSFRCTVRKTFNKYGNLDFLKISGQEIVIYYTCMLHKIFSRCFFQSNDHSMSSVPIFYKKIDDLYNRFVNNFLTQVLSLFSENKNCNGFLIAGNHKLNDSYFDEANKFDIIPYAFPIEFYNTGRNLSLEVLETNKTLISPNYLNRSNISYRLLKILEAKNECFSFQTDFSGFSKKISKSIDESRFENFRLHYFIKNMSLQFELNADSYDVNLAPDKGAVAISLTSNGTNQLFVLKFDFQTRELLDIEFDRNMVDKKINWNIKNQKKYLSSVFNNITKFVILWDLRYSD